MSRSLKFLLLLALTAVLAGCGSKTPAPPVAAVRPHELTAHGDVRSDDYYWLNQREDPEVLAYLEAENAYLEAAAAPLADLRETLFAEMKGRIKEDDASVPYRLRGYWYTTRFVAGGEYPLHCRQAGTLQAPEEVLLDGNALGAGHDYFALRGTEVSPDDRLLVFGVDTVGRRFYTLRVKDLTTGELLSDEIPDVTDNVVWALDNRTLFYARQDPATLRSWQIWRHRLGTDAARDELVYQEDDETFTCSVRRTKSDRYLVIDCEQTLSSESRILEADRPDGQFRIFQPRERDLEYAIDHLGDRWLIRTNLDARNFRLMECALAWTGRDGWREVLPHRQDVLLEGFDLFRDFLVTTERFDGLRHLRVIPWDGSPDHVLDFGEPTWSVRTGDNPELDAGVLRFDYSSLTTPNSVFDYDMAARRKTLLKQDEVLGGFDPAAYRCEYLMAPARDGTPVPISLVARTDTPRDGTAPLLLYGYGSYGYSASADFDGNVLSLLDRGFVYAIAHVRGGQEMGRRWYEDGKLLKKMNTFTDFIDCGRYLVDQGYAARDELFAEGGSAGGLLMGAVINLEPGLWRGVAAHVPFVDVVTTMLDESIPLTTGEYDEWGNPHEKVYYDYMLSYSPYDQVTAQAYPALLVTTGLHDSQVQYFEPAKWVARLRALKTDDNPLWFKINMGAGHGGASGRFRRLEETALSYAFFCDLAGIRR